MEFSRRRFLETTILSLIGIGAMAGCKSPDSALRPTSTPFYYEPDPFTGFGPEWIVTRIGQNEFVIDGIDYRHDLNENKANAFKGIQYIQDQLGCEILDFGEFQGYPGEAISARWVVVENPSCIISGFPLKQTTPKP